MEQLTSIEREIKEMRDIFIASKKWVNGWEAEEQDRMEEENPRNIILDLQQIGYKVGVEKVDKY